MPICPAGHDSASGDFCDVCGIRVAAEPAVTCPRCEAACSGRFCEACGFDRDTGRAPGSSPPPAVAAGDSAARAEPGGQAMWTVVVASDRAHFDTVIAAGGLDAAAIQFPVHCPERRFWLTGHQVRIGRHSPSRGQEPEIDLTGPPTDPGISRLHAILTIQPDGSWAIVDPGSANGTSVNGSDLVAGSPVTLRDGDQIRIGAWTRITVHAGRPPSTIGVV